MSTAKRNKRARKVVVVDRELFDLQDKRRSLLFEIMNQGIKLSTVEALEDNWRKIDVRMDSTFSPMSLREYQKLGDKRSAYVLDDGYEYLLEKILDKLDRIVFEGMNAEDVKALHALDKQRKGLARRVDVLSEPFDVAKYIGTMARSRMTRKASRR